MKRLAAGLCLLLAACVHAPAPMPPLPLPEPPPPGEPAGLIGLSQADLRGFFGTPSFVRKESGAELWRYDGAKCQAFFFFYPKGDAKVVRHVETVPRGGAIAADSNCLDVLRGRAPAS